jgi:hypothetical protein
VKSCEGIELNPKRFCADAVSRRKMCASGFLANSIRDSFRTEVICREVFARDSGEIADGAIFCARGWIGSIDMRHPRVALARKMDWAFLEKTFGPTRMARSIAADGGADHPQYTHDLSDEVLCERG